MVIRSSDLDLGFVQEISKISGDTVRSCFQCGTCTGTCPSGRLTSLRIRTIIRKAVLGLKKEVLSSPAIWDCMICFKCQEQCPRGVNIPIVMLALRNLAVREGIVPPEGYLKMGKSVFEEGAVQPPQEVVTRDFESFTRASFNLPSPSKPADLSKFSRALTEVGLRKVIGG
jgi:heterodisulfide reductase subunit C